MEYLKLPVLPKYPCPVCYSYELELIKIPPREHSGELEGFKVACNSWNIRACNYEVRSFSANSAEAAIKDWDKGFLESKRKRRENCLKYRRIRKKRELT